MAVRILPTNGVLHRRCGLIDRRSDEPPRFFGGATLSGLLPLLRGFCVFELQRFLRLTLYDMDHGWIMVVGLCGRESQSGCDAGGSKSLDMGYSELARR